MSAKFCHFNYNCKCKSKYETEKDAYFVILLIRVQKLWKFGTSGPGYPFLQKKPQMLS